MNKKKYGYVVFTAVCMILCMIPFVGMTFARTDTTTENKTLAKLPALQNEDGTVNMDFLGGLGAYFEDHFAFRPQLVTADSMVQSRVFDVSNIDTVIYGTDGWLYYASTLDDYLGQNTLSDRAIYSAAHNLSLMQQYVNGQGADFLLAIPPNKNSLYGKNMPYYDKRKVSSDKNIDALVPQLEEQKVSYLDLFSLFEEKDEVLYLQRDSHWNNEGALMVYQAIFDALDMEHGSYDSVDITRARNEVGDLNRMLYPIGAEPEWNTDYKYDSTYEYTLENTAGVEDPVIRTYNEYGSGSLLMFRDSFGNTLLPLAANAVEYGYFYKTMPYDIAALMEDFRPDAVVVEKVERNIRDFAELPPIMPGLAVELGNAKDVSADCTLDLHSSEVNVLYYEVAGIIDENFADVDSDIYVRIRQGASDVAYEAFTVADEESDYGYLLYLPRSEVDEGALTASVYVQKGGELLCIQSQDFWIEENEE